MENKRYWALRSEELREIAEKAEKEAKAKHPKQRRRRFDEETGGIIKGIKAKGQLIEADDLTALHPEAVVYEHKVNLGTKKWADYRLNYAVAYGTIEKETEVSVKIGGNWYRKEKIIALVMQREVPKV